MSLTDSPLNAAMERLPIPTLWQLLKLPGQPGRECFCPFHENRKTKAASVYEMNGSYFFKCHAGCTDKAVDSPGFLALATGSSNGEACRRLIEMAGCLPHAEERTVRSSSAYPSGNDDAGRLAKRKAWPRFDYPTGEEIKTIAALRGLTLSSVTDAVIDGLVWCCDSREGRAWIATDSSRKNAQARLLSGAPWAAGMKAKNLPGSIASWPIGLPLVEFPVFSVALVEGGPDLLAAYDIAQRLGLHKNVAAVAMLGAAHRIPDETLSRFIGKRVRIFVHDDEAGKKAGERWGQKLLEAGVDVDGYSFADLVQANRDPVKDLNDFLRMVPEQIEKHAADAFAFAAKTPCVA